VKLSIRMFYSRNFLVSALSWAFMLQLPAPQMPGNGLPSAAVPKEIVRRCVESDDRTVELARNYTYNQRVVRKHFDSQDGVKSVHIETWEIINLFGESYSRLIQRDDKPLSAGEETKEQEKLEKFFNKLRRESEKERQKRQAKEKKRRAEERAYLHDIVNAYDFRIVGEEALDGRDVWVIEATPTKNFHPTQPHANLLSKITGKAWIDKQDYGWVKVEGEAIDTIPLALFLARIHKGTRFDLERVRLNNEIWLKHRFHVEAKARVLLLSNRSVELESTFSNFKKFSTTTKILPEVREAEPK
jgi:hypothetical protein